ncbi:hypothetical protein SCH01S_45_01300 [Sphingomonas changbaiensis NBRC 104936]|uniref:Uncharacterized protein n=1 Tax=Sphingomonas changbaiensis NBRC 104936 TaxID=1219043 RepID=A0A0E9MS80_9SPHN|nr:hypothetical protein [Sphingomonas changbaiensis]GAO40286.1 hypothetical protein SCH01S_45_01300 [Sphingomonas changbaiensis NBRC 104936]
MSTDYTTLETRPARSRLPIVIGLIAFVAGLVLAGWLLSRWDTARNWLLGTTTPAAASAPPAQPARVAQTTPMVPAPPPSSMDPNATAALGQRVGEIETRIDRVAERANAAGDNAARAEGLLIAFAARRALERGLGLGYIEAQLRERFGATQPQAVATVIAASRDPITLEELQLGLDDLAPSLTSGTSEEGWWASLKGELANLVVVRKAGQPSPVPAERLRHARRLLEGGQVEKALVEVARLPGRAKAQNWMRAARLYIQARQALDVIETAAILTPRAPVTPPPLLPEPPPTM